MKSFWPAASLILLPVAVLTGLAGYGLVQHRAAVEAQAVRDCRISQVAETWSAVLDAVLEAGPDVVLYEDPPVPQPPSADAAALESALATTDRTALQSLLGSTQRTAAGLPVAVLAGWHLANESKAAADVQAGIRSALGEHPSPISSRLIAQLAGLLPEADTAGYEALWLQMEARRHALRMRNPAWKADFAEPESVLPGGGPTDHALVSPRQAGRSRVLLASDLEACRLQLQTQTARFLPPWAEVLVVALPAADLPHFANTASRGFEICVRPSAEANFYAEHDQLVRWATALISTAALTAIIGLWIIRRTLERERKLNEMKSAFVSSVSHELRAPIGSVRLMADALASGKVTGTPAAEFHRLIASEGSRLSALIENVLDFARIEAGRKRYTFAETDLHALLNDAVRLMTPQAEARQQTIRCELEPLPCDPWLDAPAMQQAVINLLDNALKFSPPSSEISILLERGVALRPTAHGPAAQAMQRSATPRSHAAFTITITDPGPGIPASEHQRIFERFYRLGNELQRETTGTGIGLAIVKHVVEGHGGRVEVYSFQFSDFSSQHGTIMVVTLPTAPLKTEI